METIKVNCEFKKIGSIPFACLANGTFFNFRNHCFVKDGPWGICLDGQSVQLLSTTIIDVLELVQP